MVKVDATKQALNRVVKTLTAADQAYFGELQAFVTTKNFWGNEQAADQALLGMAQDLREAEANGEDAQSLFGDDARGMATALIQNLPRPSLRDHLELLAIVIGFSWLFLLLNGGYSTLNASTFSGFTFLMAPVIEGFGIWGLFKLVNLTTFPKVQWLANKRVASGLLIALIMVVMGLLIGLYVWRPNIWLISVPTPWDYAVVALMVVAYLVYALISRDKDNAIIAVIIMLFGALTALNMAQAHHHLQLDAKTGGFLVAGCLVAVFLVYLWHARRVAKRP